LVAWVNNISEKVDNTALVIGVEDLDTLAQFVLLIVVHWALADRLLKCSFDQVVYLLKLSLSLTLLTEPPLRLVHWGHTIFLVHIDFILQVCRFFALF
jgi:hypothetical protein